ncbi:MAG: SAM-dependent methyltransferase [Actinotalea sp.]|nr:SAM-dependent methyltransferase [Actinotalea sp.]
MDGADEDHWSAVAADWAELWAGSMGPVRAAIIDATGVRTGSRVLDVGCGSGELLADLLGAGATASGVDPAPRMVCLARTTAPGADVRLGPAERLPWPDAVFDVATAVNALQLADDTVDALAEVARVMVPGGLVAIANWAEGTLNDLDLLEAAAAAAAEEERKPDGELRRAGGQEALLAEVGLDHVMSRLVELPWEPPDDDALVRGVLLGEDADTLAELGPAVLAAAEPFRTPDGGYRVINRFRLCIGRVGQVERVGQVRRVGPR